MTGKPVKHHFILAQHIFTFCK